MENETKPLKKVKEIAKITGLDRRTIIRHINAGLLKANKIGKSWMVSQENLEKYLNPETNE